MDSGFSVVQHYASCFIPEDNGTWTMTSWNNDISLAFIKTRNTKRGKVEVHIASGSSNFKNRSYESETAFNCEDHGVWSLAISDSNDPPDLIYVKTNNTASGKVEVHIASGASHYKNFSLHAVSDFACENDGIWSTASGGWDLGFMKTANTVTGKVELHIASYASQYKARIIETGTGFALGSKGNLSWGYDGYGGPYVTLITNVGTISGSVEVGSAGVPITYVSTVQTPFGTEDNGVWLFYEPLRGIVYIKTKNTQSGMVEVHTGIYSGAANNRNELRKRLDRRIDGFRLS